MKTDKLKYHATVAVIFVLMLSLTNCTAKQEKSAYEELLASELGKELRYDSLFLGIQFGMNQKDFYAHCWKLNKEGLIIQGPNNLSIQYSLDDGLKDKAMMHFYPTFYNKKVMEMPVIFTYEAWSPWNKALSPDSLIYDVKAMLETWYGGEFMEMDDTGKGKSFVKIDGNRRIGLYIKNETSVMCLMTDLLAKNELLIEEKLKERKNENN